MLKKDMLRYDALVDGKYVRKFEKKKDSFMNSTWEKFNKYAKIKGFTKVVEDGKYFGSMAWMNERGEVMELVKGS